MQYGFVLAIVLFCSAACGVIRYPTPPQVEINTVPCLLPNFNYRYILCSHLDYEVNSVAHRVPDGFHTDLASIPRVFWSIFSPMKSEYIAPAIIHDFLYSSHSTTQRSDADLIFYAALRSTNVSRPVAQLFYWAVRLFGKGSYKGCPV